MELIGIPLNDVVDVMAGNGFHVSRLAPENDVKAAIARLRPVDGGHRLIRLGGDGDGGYLVPDDLSGIDACFSPGVSDVAGFEEQLARDYGIRSFLADGSVSAPPVDDPLFDFERKHLGLVTDDRTMRLADWVAAKDPTGGTGDLILQMDIEGAEYPVLVDTPVDVLERFRVIVVELHGLGALFSREALPLLDAVFAKLTRGHSVVHLHPNNDGGGASNYALEIPRIMEVTLLRNDRVTSCDPRTDFPHALDRKNRADTEDRVLPACWYAA